MKKNGWIGWVVIIKEKIHIYNYIYIYIYKMIKYIYIMNLTVFDSNSERCLCEEVMGQYGENILL